MSNKMGAFSLEDGTGDGIQVSPNDRGLHITVHSDWAGSTETGFGANCSYTISKAEAENLCLWMQTYLAHTP